MEKDRQHKTSEGFKKVYTRPEITRVDLHAEEAVLGACKNAASAGPVGGAAFCQSVITCSTLGS